jgi:hypothetical protein
LPAHLRTRKTGQGILYNSSSFADKMVQKYCFCSFCLLLTLLLLPHSAVSAPANNTSQRDIVITLPAETVLASLKKILPLDIPSQNPQLQGDIVLESLDRLVIRDNIITVHGVLSGRNLVVVTNIAGQDIQLRVGQVHLPITCDLHIRFDPVQRKLFVTPRFTDTGAGNNGQEGSLAPLLGALGGREHLVKLDALRLLNIKIGTRSIPIAMEPVKITGTDNALVLYLLPQIGTPK